MRFVRVTNQTGYNLNVRCLATGQNVNISHGSSTNFGGSVQLQYSGLTAGSTISVSGTIPDYAIEWNRVGSPSVDAGSRTAAGFDFEGEAVYGASPYVVSHTFTQASFTIGGGGISGNYSDVAGDSQNEDPPLELADRKELMLLLNNETGVPQTIMWGDKPMTLQPGVNAIRYDGPIDSNGMPLVAPSDFQGTYFDGGGNISPSAVPLGSPYVYGRLGFHSSDEGIAWQSPPPMTTANQAPPGVPWMEVISPQRSNSGPTVIFHAADGSRTITTLPAGGGGASNTSGGGAVLSNPLAPAPPQSTSNTTTNITNNTTSTTNNTTTNNNVTNIGNDGTPEPEGNAGELNGLTGDGTLVADPEGEPGDLTGDLDGVKDSILDRLQGYQVLEAGALPKASSFPVNLPLGGSYGNYVTSIDLTQTPFPQVRFALLVMLTLGLAIGFLNRITI